MSVGGRTFSFPINGWGEEAELGILIRRTLAWHESWGLLVCCSCIGI